MHAGGLLEATARVGYGARGTVYLVVAALAVLAGLGSSGEVAGTQGALEALARQPAGRFVVGLVGAGLLAFALWRALQSLLDADRHGDEAKALVIRTALGVSAVVHLALAVSAFHLLLGMGGGADEDRSAQDWTAWLMARPFGIWLVAAVGLIVVAAGIAIAAKGWTRKFERRLALDPSARRWVVPVAQVGLMARGFVYVLTGAFLVLAAFHANPSEAKGLSGALEALRAQEFGGALLMLAGAGLLGFGAYGLVQAKYRRLESACFVDADLLTGGHVMESPPPARIAPARRA